MEKTLPGAAASAAEAETSPNSWSSRPMKWPSRWVNCGPKPASVMISRAIRSSSRSGTPGRTACSAASLARRTTS